MAVVAGASAALCRREPSELQSDTLVCHCTARRLSFLPSFFFCYLLSRYRGYFCCRCRCCNDGGDGSTRIDNKSFARSTTTSTSTGSSSSFTTVVDRKQTLCCFRRSCWKTTVGGLCLALTLAVAVKTNTMKNNKKKKIEKEREIEIELENRQEATMSTATGEHRGRAHQERRHTHKHILLH